MMRYEPGHLARSLAGRDKGRLFIIIGTEGEYVSLADGRNHTAGRPKRKKKKHVQLQYPKEDTLKQKLKQMEAVSDEEIRNYLQQYR